MELLINDLITFTELCVTKDLSYNTNNKLIDKYGHVLCKELLCDKQPYFNKPSEKIGLYCKTHKLPDMVNIVSKQCIHPECISQPVYNTSNEKIGLYCKTHKLPDMIDVKNKRCIHLGCISINPKFNKPSEKSGEYCGVHKLPGMIDVISKRCIHPDCTSTSRVFNKTDEKIGLYCGVHKLYSMIDVVSKRCINPDCDKYPLPKFKYCSDCFRYNFPHHKRWKNIKQKEVYITKDVAKHFPNLNLIFDKKIDCQSCNARRPDTFLDLAHYTIILEIDENQHRNYSCENKRTMELFQSLGNRPIVFIRFNPDRYNNQKGIFKFSESGLISANNLYKERFNKLIETFKYHLENKPTKEVTIDHLFYDTF